jgi:hypothetical protein
VIQDLRDGIIGIGFPSLGVITSFQEQIEWHFRLLGLIVGFLVGLFTLVTIIRRMRKE